MSPTPSTSRDVTTEWTSISESGLLAQHSNDPAAALNALVAHHNALVRRYATLQREKEAAEKAAERSAIENQQLWRSFKSTGITGSSPRPSGSRQNSESGGRQFGSLGDRSVFPTTGGPFVRKGMSPEMPSGPLGGSNKSADSSSSSARIFPSSRNSAGAEDLNLQSQTPPRKTSTPPPISPRSSTLLRSSSHISLRKAASLDLGRPLATNGTDNHDPDGGVPFSRLASVEKPPTATSRLPMSTSMPSMVTPEEEGTTGLFPTRRYLPSLVPVSPLQIVHQQHDHDQQSSGSSPRDRVSPGYPSASPNNMDSSSSSGQLQPPDASEAIRRTRSSSNNSSSSQGSGADDRSGLSSNTRSLPPHEEFVTPTTDAVPNYPFPSYSMQQSPDPQHHRSIGSEQTLSAFSAPEGSTSSYPFSTSHPTASPVAAPSPRPTLSPAFLPFTQVRVGSSNIKTNEKGKEVISFLVEVTVTVPPESDPEHQGGSASWKVEKKYSDVLVLDSTVKSKSSKQESKAIAALPDKNLFKDHAPHKSDQRKAVLEKYLQTLLTIPLRDKTVVCAFFNSDLATDQSGPTPAPGTMEGWLTKRGRNFGGWQTRYYVLQNDTLSYYDIREGSKLGEIPLQHAAIGRQSSKSADAGDDSYLHAFLIRTTTKTKDDKDQDADHILCAESDDARDAWVMALTSLQSAAPGGRANGRGSDDSRRQLTKERRRSGSMSGIADAAEGGRLHSRRTASSDLPPSTSLPASLDLMARSELGKRANSEMGQYADLQRNKLQAPPGRRGDSGKLERPSTPDRRPSDAAAANKFVASQVSGPMNAAPLPSGYDFKKADRSKKTKSSFWNFGNRGGPNDKAAAAGSISALPTAPPRPVFGVPLKEAVAISRIRPGLELPAVVYRCVEYLEAKNAESEEGIFRLSGSANVIRLLKDRFNAEGDVQLLNSNEYYDPHAVAGLLKAFLRELPVHLLTRELHPEFIQVIDLRNRKDRVNALGKLVARLPIEEYTLFRFFFAHLCVIAQNAEVSKMNLRNLGIVFSPTLAIPAPLFTLLLAEFDLVFAVEKETGLSRPIIIEDDETPTELRYPIDGHDRRPRPNSELYERSGANILMESEARGGKLRDQVDEESELESDAYEEAPEDSESPLGVVSSALPFPGSNAQQQEYLHLPGTPQQPSSPNQSPRSTTFANPYNSPHMHSSQLQRGLPASPRPGATFQQSMPPPLSDPSA